MMAKAPNNRSIDGERGFVIITVLWLLAALAALALIFSVYLANRPGPLP